MLRKILFPIFVIFFGLLLSGCIPGIFSPLFLQTAGSLGATFPTLAIDNQGVKHLAWLEGTSTAKSVVYWRGWFSNPAYEYRHNDPFAYLPRIAVTDSGDAYVVWSRFLLDDVEYCYWKISAAGSTLINCDDFAADRHGKGIWVVARGEVVYVLYDSGNRLYYRQLAGGISQGAASDIYDPETFLSSNVVLRIDSNGKLHLLRMIQSGTTYSLIYNSNATEDSGNMDQQVVVADTGGGPFDLAISNLSGNERVYLIYRAGTPSENTINYYQCLANGCSGQGSGQIPFDGTGWQISEIKSAGTNTTLYIALIARNSSTPGTEPQDVYLSTALQKPNLIPDAEYYPKRHLHLVTVGTPSLPVLAWRKAISGNSTDVYAAYLVLEGGFPVMKVQQVFTRFEPYIAPEGNALAANGEWVAGTWLYAQSPTISRIVPWIAGNAYVSNLPLVSK